MPDRFDLMDTADIRSAFRISADYCRVVNADRLTAEDVERLDRGRAWLELLAAGLPSALEAGEIDPVLIEGPPPARDSSASTENALDRFTAASDSALVAVQQLLRSPRSEIHGGRGKVSHLDLARHLTRIPNSCSVDRIWHWV